jgi:hypothetical protein
MRRALLIVLAGLAAAVPGAASAHAVLERTTPRVGSPHNAAPAEIRLEFSEPVEPAFARVALNGPSGPVAASIASATSADRRTLILRPHAKLGPGLYKVVWRVVSVDGHASQGAFTFGVD